jgi:hypothetical protein
MNQRRLGNALLLAVLSLDACATAPSCVPVAVTVAAKERRTRVGLESGALQSTPTGQVREALRESFVAEYWVQDSQGRWHQVSEATWQRAEPGQRVELCR